jgi:hypothetical protein
MQKQNTRQTFNYLLYAILFAIGSLALYFNQPKGENKVVEEKNSFIRLQKLWMTVK